MGRERFPQRAPGRLDASDAANAGLRVVRLVQEVRPRHQDAVVRRALHEHVEVRDLAEVDAELALHVAQRDAEDLAQRRARHVRVVSLVPRDDLLVNLEIKLSLLLHPDGRADLWGVLKSNGLQRF